MESDKPAPLRVDAETAIILREAYHKIQSLYRGDHYGLYDYVRAVVSKIARVDTFYVGFLHGTNRVRYPYGYDSGQYLDPDTHNFGPNGQTAWLLKHRHTYRLAYDNGAVLRLRNPHRRRQPCVGGCGHGADLPSRRRWDGSLVRHVVDAQLRAEQL